jgi:predicted lipid-binding transport protein (Tim44 family)
MFRPQPAVVATSPTYVTNNYPPQSSAQATQAQPQVVNNYYGSNPSSNNQGNSSSANTNANQQTAASAPNSTPSTQANTPLATDANQSMPPQQPQDDGQSDFMKIIGYLAGLTIWLILLSGLFLLVRKIRNKNN